MIMATLEPQPPQDGPVSTPASPEEAADPNPESTQSSATAEPRNDEPPFFSGDGRQVSAQVAVFIGGIKALGSDPRSDKVEEKADDRMQEPSLFEATRSMPQPRPLFPPDGDDLSRWVSKLRDSYFLILLSCDINSLYSAAWVIGEKLSDYYRPVLLSPDFQASAPTPVSPLQMARKGDPAALVIADAKGCKDIVDAAVRNPGNVSLITQSLRASNRLLLLLANNEILGWSDNPAQHQTKNAHVPCARVPFIAPRLKNVFPDAWKELEAEICRQRKAGRWLEPEEKLFNQITTYLGQNRLLEEIESRKQGQSAPTSLRAHSLLSPRAPLDNAALFLATFFPGLAIRDFERLLLTLLGDRAQAIQTPTYVLSPEGEGRVKEVTESRLLRDIWSETYPEVLERCRLQILSVEKARADGNAVVAVIELAMPELREGLREAFIGPHAPLFFALFRLVRGARLLFDGDPEIGEATLRLLVETALAHPGELAGPCLGGWLPLPAGRSSGVAAAGAADWPEAPSSDLAIARLYPCLRAFLQRPRLRELAAQFFQELLAARRYGDLVELVWAVRNVADFDALFWFKRLVNEGDEDARRKAGAKLRRAVRSGSAGEILPRVFGWLPPPGAAVAGAPAAVSRSFFVDLNEELLFEARRSRGNPPANPLLSAAAQEGGEDLAALSIAWLFHPAVAPVLAERAGAHLGKWVQLWLLPSQLRAAALGERHRDGFLGDLERRWDEAMSDPAIDDPQVLDALIFPAFVLADWAAELLREDPPSPAAAALLERLLAGLARQCDASRRHHLRVLWAVVEDCLLDLLAFLAQLDPRPAELDRKSVEALRQELQARRRCVKQLRLGLHSLSRPAASR